MKRQTFQRIKAYLGVTLVGLFSLSASYAQSIVTGTVLDENKLSVIGANVVEVGGDVLNGTVTNIDGEFSIKVSDPSTAKLQISFIGYESITLPVAGKKHLEVQLAMTQNELQEVTAVAYGVQKKATLTGAISAVKTDALLASPNASVANSLAGKITGLSSTQVSGQPGMEDPTIYIRGVGSLTEGSSSPLILVDGVENSFFQMDPNEIESISVLKDASATAVFGVRGANGVIIVTTRRGEEGKAKISVNSSVGLQAPTRMLDMVDSYTFATVARRIDERDGKAPAQYSFSDYDMERFRLKDDPMMYPDINWREELMKESAVQTQHNINISGGTSKVRYFVSAGFLYQDGLFEQFGDIPYDNNYSYTRYNYRSNLDIDITQSTLLKMGIGGIVGSRREPNKVDFNVLNWTQPFSSPGFVDGELYMIDVKKYQGIIMDNNVLTHLYGTGYSKYINNKMNIDLTVTQDLEKITKGLSLDVKGAYNADYTYKQVAASPDVWNGILEYNQLYYKSELDGSGLSAGDPGFDYTHVSKIAGKKALLTYTNTIPFRNRNWYFETSMRYNRKFGDHTVSGLLLYNQSKTYYPSTFMEIPSGYVGLVGRATYDYKSRYLAEFNIGHNGSENFAPGKRYGTFPAGSLGYVITEEDFMKSQNVVDYLKLRASVGLVGNDKLGSDRFLYLPDSYSLDLAGMKDGSNGFNTKFGLFNHGYNFGVNAGQLLGVTEKNMGNPDVTWETALKQNYGIDSYFFNERLKISADYFLELRKDILINRNTYPSFAGIDGLLPAVNMGRVKNQGYEVEVKWNDTYGDLRYYVDANVSYSKNKILEMDEVTPAYPYMARTNTEVGAIFGYEFDRLFTADDFNITTQNGKEVYTLKEGIPNHNNSSIRPGDAKYVDLNKDGEINDFDQHHIASSRRPDYIVGLNMGVDWKGFFISMNWQGALGRTLVLENAFRSTTIDRSMMKYVVDGAWMEETALTHPQTEFPRMSSLSASNNGKLSSLWLRDGSYVKLKNFTIGYNYTNRERLKAIGANSIGIKFTGYNLLTFDKFKIMDPESNPNQYDKYPVVKIFNVGVNVNF